MLNNPEDIEKFLAFSAAGGIKQPETLITGQRINAKAKVVYGQIEQIILSDANYKDTQPLIDALNSISTELKTTESTTSLWNAYLTETSTPVALEVPSQGYDVLCKINNSDNAVPPPFTFPITEKEDINALEQSVLAIEIQIDSALPIVAEINDIIDLGDIPPLPGTPEPVIPQELIDRAVAKAAELSAIEGSTSLITGALGVMVSTAKSNKQQATDAYYQAIDFTIISTQQKRPSIGAAVAEIYPS